MATAQQPAPKPGPGHHGPTAANPAAAQKPAKTPAERMGVQRPVILLAVGLLVGLGIGLGVWLWRGKGSAQTEPPINDLTENLAKFMATKAYEKLPFERQKVFMRVIDKREDKGELMQAYREKKITPAEYRTGLGEAWLGKHLARVERYAEAQGVVAKYAVLDEIIANKEKDDDKPPKPGKGEDFILAIDGSHLPKIKKDKTAERMRIGTFPQEVQDEWRRFEKALKAREKQHDAAEEAARLKAAAAKSQPATRGSSTGPANP